MTVIIPDKENILRQNLKQEPDFRLDYLGLGGQPVLAVEEDYVVQSGQSVTQDGQTAGESVCERERHRTDRRLGRG